MFPLNKQNCNNFIVEKSKKTNNNYKKIIRRKNQLEVYGIGIHLFFLILRNRFKNSTQHRIYALKKLETIFGWKFSKNRSGVGHISRGQF